MKPPTRVWLVIKLNTWTEDVADRRIVGVYANEAAARAKAAVPDDDGDLVVEEHGVQQ